MPPINDRKSKNKNSPPKNVLDKSNTIFEKNSVPNVQEITMKPINKPNVFNSLRDCFSNMLKTPFYFDFIEKVHA